MAAFPQTLLEKAAAARAEALALLPAQGVCEKCHVLGSGIEPTFFDISGTKTLGGILKCQECGHETNFVPEARQIH